MSVSIQTSHMISLTALLGLGGGGHGHQDSTTTPAPDGAVIGALCLSPPHPHYTDANTLVRDGTAFSRPQFPFFNTRGWDSLPILPQVSMSVPTDPLP